MRVLHVTSGRLFGGIEQMLLTMARCADVAPEMESMFAVAAPGRLEDDLRTAGAPVHPLGDVRLSRPASVIQARSRFARLVDRTRPAAVVCHAPWSFAVFAGVARRRNVRVVLWQHDYASGRPFVERWAKRTRADLVICNSRWTSGTSAALQPGVATSVIHPPVAVPAGPRRTRDEMRSELRTGDRQVVILCASRMEPWKGHANVLRALAAMQDDPSWTCWIAGGAQRRHELDYVLKLQQDVERLGLASRVSFLGTRSDIAALMGAADLFCQMNDGPEPFGIVFAEALLAGLPVIAADLGGAPEIVSDTCGRLVPAGDIAALSTALRQIVDDGALRARLGANGPSHAAARSSPEVVMPAICRALSSACASGPT